MGLVEFVGSVDLERESFPGYEDFLSLPFFALFFPSVRYFLDRFVFENLGRRLILGKGQLGPNIETDEKIKKIKKFKESAWKCVYFLSAEILALSVTYDEPWFTNTRYFWVGPGNQVWPDMKIKLKLKGLYMYATGFYTYSIFALIFWETRRSDFGVSMGHHVATIVLIVLSYILRFARVGSVVLALHDASDIFLEVGKMSKYSGAETLASLSFIIFVLSWILLRLIYYPFWILWSTSYEVLLTLDKDNHKVEGPICYYVFNSLLFCLFVLHIYWWVLIYRMLVKQIKARGQISEDVRSDSDAEPQPTSLSLSHYAHSYTHSYIFFFQLIGMAKDVEGAEGGEFSAKDYHDPPPAPLIDAEELTKWSFYRAIIAEFIATLLFLYITVLTVIGYKSQTDPAKNSDECGGVGILGIAWAFGGMIFILVYCTAGISGGHINPAVTFGLFVGRKVSLIRAVMYMVAQCLGAICGVGLVKGFQKSYYVRYGGGANELASGYNKGVGLGAEIIGTFVLVYTVFAATDPKRNARDSHVPVLAPLPIGFAVFMVHLATIPITGTGINPARSFGAAVIYNKEKAWDDQWIFWVGPFVGAAVAAFYHQYILRASAIKALGSFRSNA